MECIIRMLIQYFFRSLRVCACAPFWTVFSYFSLDFTHLLQWLSPFSRKKQHRECECVCVAVKCVKCKIRYALEYNSLTASHECTHVCITFWKINFYDDDCGKTISRANQKRNWRMKGKRTVMLQQQRHQPTTMERKINAYAFTYLVYFIGWIHD